MNTLAQNEDLTLILHTSVFFWAFYNYYNNKTMFAFTIVANYVKYICDKNHVYTYCNKLN